MLHNGLYEQIINKGLDAELAQTDKLSKTEPIDEAEAAKVLAKYVTDIVEKGLQNVKDKGGDIHSQVELVNRVVSTIMAETQEADHVRHTGSRPMNITWRLDHPIPAKYLKKTNKLVVGLKHIFAAAWSENRKN